MSIDMLLSTDIGTDPDDAVALYLAMNSPTVSLKGVYVTNGPVVERAKIARHMMDLAGCDAPVMVGEPEALFTKSGLYLVGPEYCLAPKRREEPEIVRDWLPAMVAQLEGLKDAVVASIAPLTNIAVLLQKAPEAASRIRTLYIMGGREGHNEHNFTHDSKAADIVLRSGLDIVIVPADVASNYLFPIDDILAIGGNRAQGYLRHMVSLWKLFHDSSHVLTPKLFKRVDRAPLAADIASLRGGGAAKAYWERFGRFKFMLSMLCNARNFRDDPLWHLNEYGKLRSWVGDNLDKAYVKEYIRHIAESGEMTHTKVSDAFVIYAIEHPELIKERRVNASVDELGIMTSSPGDRHRIITDVDYGHFTDYLKRRLREKPAKGQVRRAQRWTR